MYNLTFTEGNSLTGLFLGVNTESGGIFGGVLLMAIFLIVLISTRSDDFKIKITTSSFITTIIAGVMLGLGWIKALYFTIAVFALLISVFILIWSKE